MEAAQKAVAATLEFLKKNQKLDVATYATIETAQTKNLVAQLAHFQLDLEAAGQLSELVGQSCLSPANKASICGAISARICGGGQSNKRSPQHMVAGFLNYLTKTDRNGIANTEVHEFTRAAIAVRRCLAVGLILPTEKSHGHICATLAELGLAKVGDSIECNKLLLEWKRQMRLARSDTDPTLVVSYPPDPRQLPKDLFEQSYGAGEDLFPAALASQKPGKWLRSSSKDLNPVAALTPLVPSSGANAMMPPHWMQMMQGFQQFSAMAAQMNGGLDNLVTFPRHKRARTSGEGAGQGAPLALQDDVRNQASPPPLEDKTDESPELSSSVKKPAGIPDKPPAFAMPGNESGTAEQQALADQEVDAHLNTMGNAFVARTKAKPQKPGPLKRPAASTKSSAKAKAKPSTKPDAGPCESKGKGKGIKGKGAATKRPPMMETGAPTVYYLQGKIHRSEAGQCFRVFRHWQDRCDLKVAFKGNARAAWSVALSKIEQHAGK